MKAILKKTKYIILAVLIAAFILVPMNLTYAEELTDGEERAEAVKELVNYLIIHTRYEDISKESLYMNGLVGLIEENPELYESVMKNILESIDEHSEYYNAEEAQLLNEQVTGKIVGIGITFQMCPDGVDVRSVIPETPAAKAGVQVGDVIVSVDDILLSGMNSDTAASYIRGEEGTSLRVGIKRKGISDVIYFDITREEIIGTSVTNEIYEDGENKLMHIRVYGFVANTAQCFKEALDEAEKNEISNLIIDLRDNGGGLLSQAVEMADYLVPKGSVITTEDHKISFLNSVYIAEYDDTAKFNTVVLINENSASASEVFAAALSENDSAVLIGTKSYGKGTIQNMVNITYGDSMKFTVGYYLTPNGNNINGIGLTPDAIVENSEKPFEIEKYKKFGYNYVYQIGDKGSEIKTAKELLSAWGVFFGEINDTYDVELKNAVFKFQSATGLYPYGVLDLTTQQQLYDRLAKSKVVNDDQLDAAFAHFGMKMK